MGSDTSKLEQRIASSLSNGSASSDALMELVEDTVAAAAAAEQDAAAERDRALDLTIAPDIDKAHAALVAAELRRDRLQAVLPRLRQRLSEALGAEAHARWFAVYERTEKLRDAAAAKFAEHCPRLLAELVTLFRDADAVDQEVSRVNGSAPSGERRRLLAVELQARAMTDFSIKPSITATIRLPDWDTGQIIWPVRSDDLAVSVAMAMRPPHDIRYTGEWWKAAEADNAERRRLAERRAAEAEAEQAAARQRYEARLLEEEKRARERQRG
jgi:hypothetical protein